MENNKPKNKLQRLTMIKKRLPFKIKNIGKFDVSNLISKLDNIKPDYWLEQEYRQKMKTHSKTHTLEIMWNPECLKDNKKGKKHERNYNLLEFDKILDELRPIYESEFGSGDFHRILMTRLKPKSEIPVHCDGGVGLMQGRRTHIPLITNKEIIFRVGKDLEQFHLEAGNIYELNNAKKHAVNNPTDEHRIHLIIDWLEDHGFWLKKKD